MITEANTRNICVVASTQVTNGATASGSFDVRGFDFAQINVFKSVSAAVTTLKVEQSDDDSAYVTCNLTSGTDFTAATNGTSALTGVGSQPYYSFNIGVKSSLLQDLKISRQRSFFDSTGSF